MIALLDDDALLRRSVARLLKAAGYDVAQYSSGTQFLKSLRDRQPLCLMLDLHMPQMSGFAVQIALAQSGYNIPVIVMTADLTPENAARATELGAVSYVAKPVDFECLVKAVRKACAVSSCKERG